MIVHTILHALRGTFVTGAIAGAWREAVALGRMVGGNRIEEGEWALSDGQGVRRYMAGDRILVELDLEYRANLGRVFVAFTHGTDPLTEFYFEGTSFPEEDRQANLAKTSRVVLEAVVPPETVPGVYTLNRVNVFSIGGRLARLREDDLSRIAGRSFEVVEEPPDPPVVSGLRFLA
ncbi:MAG TPA: hypothetical protein VK359_02595 [Rubrobacteraceae bacterium]|nr:hypothetical protein [Rubrobacteraceae bacterium]